jgi:hypothetical protein
LRCANLGASTALPTPLSSLSKARRNVSLRTGEIAAVGLALVDEDHARRTMMLSATHVKRCIINEDKHVRQNCPLASQIRECKASDCRHGRGTSCTERGRLLVVMDVCRYRRTCRVFGSCSSRSPDLIGGTSQAKTSYLGDLFQCFEQMDGTPNSLRGELLLLRPAVILGEILSIIVTKAQSLGHASGFNYRLPGTPGTLTSVRPSSAQCQNRPGAARALIRFIRPA